MESEFHTVGAAMVKAPHNGHSNCFSRFQGQERTNAIMQACGLWKLHAQMTLVVCLSKDSAAVCNVDNFVAN